MCVWFLQEAEAERRKREKVCVPGHSCFRLRHNRVALQAGGKRYASDAVSAMGLKPVSDDEVCQIQLISHQTESIPCRRTTMLAPLAPLPPPAVVLLTHPTLARRAVGAVSTSTTRNPPNISTGIGIGIGARRSIDRGALGLDLGRVPGLRSMIVIETGTRMMMFAQTGTAAVTASATVTVIETGAGTGIGTGRVPAAIGTVVATAAVAAAVAVVPAGTGAVAALDRTRTRPSPCLLLRLMRHPATALRLPRALVIL